MINTSEKRRWCLLLAVTLLTTSVSGIIHAAIQEDKNPCLNSRITYNTETLEKIVTEPDHVIKEGMDFWKNEKPLVLVQSWADEVNVRISERTWRNNIQKLADLTPEERIHYPLLQIAGAVMDQRERFLNEGIPLLCRYVPSGIEIEIPVYFVAFVPPRAFANTDGIVVSISAPYWRGNAENILNCIIHELFHIVWSHTRQRRTEIPLEDEQLYSMLNMIQNEGMATYIGYQAVESFPAHDEVDYKLLANPDDVIRLLNDLNALLQKSGTIQEDTLRSLAWKVGVTNRAYYIVGANMAQIIEEADGRQGLAQLLLEGPIAYIKRYNSLVSEDLRIHYPGE